MNVIHPDELDDVIKLAKKGCFAESLVIQPVNLESVCIINGKKIENL